MLNVQGVSVTLQLQGVVGDRGPENVLDESPPPPSNAIIPPAVHLQQRAPEVRHHAHAVRDTPGDAAEAVARDRGGRAAGHVLLMGAAAQVAQPVPIGIMAAATSHKICKHTVIARVFHIIESTYDVEDPPCRDYNMPPEGGLAYCHFFA